MNAKYNYIDTQMHADINYNIICNIVIMPYCIMCHV